MHSRRFILRPVIMVSLALAAIAAPLFAQRQSAVPKTPPAARSAAFLPAAELQQIL